MSRLFAAAGLCLALIASPAMAAPATDPAKMPAGTYVLEKTHASLLARVRHMGLTSYTLRLNRFDATYDWDPARPEAAKLSVTIDMTSLDVGDPKISKDFAEDFLDAKKNPKATFVSTAIVRDGDRGKVTGDLTFHGVTKPVTLDVIFRGYESGLLGARAGFSATGAFKRSDFGSDNMSMFAGDDIELIIEVEFVRK
jgi:polyisoprenoid-binding protein YceI